MPEDNIGETGHIPALFHSMQMIHAWHES